MSQHVTIIDYGAGNLLNVVRAMEHLGAQVQVTNNADDVKNAQRLILPGVGAFADCMQALAAQKLIEPIRDYVARGLPFLGICVGMQVMFEVGEEFGEHAGLGLVKGRVSRIAATGADGALHKIPHIGWRALYVPQGATWSGTPLAPVVDSAGEPAVYFVHSYAGQPLVAENQLAEVDYDGVAICAAIRSGSAYGLQFHPEKSGKLGLAILQQFLKL